MTSTPKPIRGNGGDESTNSHRLTLHIPNSYPRSLSPRSSPILGNNSPSSKSVNLPAVDEQDKISPPLLSTPSSSKALLDAQSSQIKHSPSAPGLLGKDYGRVATITPSTTRRARNNELLPSSIERPEESHLIISVNKWNHIKSFFIANNTTGESARDFLARERTFFSWLRLSSTLGIASAALFLRLQLKDLSQVMKRSTIMRYEKRNGLNVIRQRAIRKYLENQHQRQLLQQNVPTKINNPIQYFSAKQNNNILDTSIALSKALGILFFILAIFSLAIGWIDYIRCVRALEHADETVPIFPPSNSHNQNQSTISTNNNDDEHPRNVERRAVAQKWHDARFARQAHSARIVFITEIIVAIVIFGTALTILITNNEASIAPLPPDEHDFRNKSH